MYPPKKLTLVKCPECGKEWTTEDDAVTRVRIGGAKCGNCGEQYGLEAIEGVYRLQDQEIVKPKMEEREHNKESPDLEEES